MVAVVKATAGWISSPKRPLPKLRREQERYKYRDMMLIRHFKVKTWSIQARCRPKDNVTWIREEHDLFYTDTLPYFPCERRLYDQHHLPYDWLGNTHGSRDLSLPERAEGPRSNPSQPPLNPPAK